MVKKKYSQHIIFGIQPNKSINKYEFNSRSTISNHLNIWHLRKNFKQFKIFLDILNYRKKNFANKPEATLIKNVFDGLDNHHSFEPIIFQQITIGLLQLGSGYYLKKMQEHLQHFNSALTPQYQEILSHINLSLQPRDELIFHGCNPDIYLWIPKHSKFPKKLIILYPTKSNTFNMPRHLAHFILAQHGIALMYIGNRPNLSENNALLGHTNEESANLIMKIAQHFQFTEIYGLGTSYGGFMICQLADQLNLKRVLNFSGAQKAPKVSNKSKKTQFLKISSRYPADRILSVLSENDDVDKLILEAYEIEGFITKRRFVQSKSHGSFSSAFLENKLDEYLDWLLND